MGKTKNKGHTVTKILPETFSFTSGIATACIVPRPAILVRLPISISFSIFVEIGN